MKTPILPEFILKFKDVQVDANSKKPSATWRNVFSEDFIGDQAKNLFATETLYGAWDGSVLILAQDALPASALKILIQDHLTKGEHRISAWRHADKAKYGDTKGIKTNSTIKSLKEKYLFEHKALFGSASAHMLYDEPFYNDAPGLECLPSYRQSLRGFNEPILQAHLQNVLLWVIENMPNLKAILCLGKRAWDLSLTISNLNFSADFKNYREAQKSVVVEISNKKIFIIPAYHPAASIQRSTMEKNWAHLKEILES